MIRYTHLQIKDLNNYDFTTILSLSGVSVDESDLAFSWYECSLIKIDLRIANLTAISIMENIFYK